MGQGSSQVNRERPLSPIRAFTKARYIRCPTSSYGRRRRGSDVVEHDAHLREIDRQLYEVVGRNPEVQSFEMERSYGEGREPWSV